MLESILKSVNDVETEAEQIMKEAETQAASIVERAKAQAKAMREEALQKVRLKNQEAADEMHQDGSLKLEAAAVESQRETNELRELVTPRKAEAVQAVISILI